MTETTKDRLERLWAPTLRRQEVMPREASDLVEAEVSIGPPVDTNGQETGVMVALYPDFAISNDLVVDGGEAVDQLHVTLVYLGTTADVGDRQDELVQLVQDWASTQPSLTGVISGFGVFTAGPTPVTYASVDCPGLPAMRQSLVEVLDRAGFVVPSEHGYTPHITLAYGDISDALEVPNLPLLFDAAVVAYGGEYQGCTFGNPPEPAVPVAPAPQAAGLFPGIFAPAVIPSTTIAPIYTQPAYIGGFVGTSQVMNGLPPFVTALSATPPAAAEPEAARAFVTEEAGRTLVTAPATTWEKALTPNQHMTWMQGRFVGAEKANRNNAFWSSGDLELGQLTVAHGPLNWLHEARHVIGTIADARYIPAKTGDQITAADGVVNEPHIVAASAIWKWIYPDEAWVVEQASEQKKLWYSMECVSDKVACVGEGSCGKEVEYAAYIAGAGCTHMQTRDTTRRFVNPTFLGGAVIVPPVRPGWADADASIMSEAARLAEKAFDQAGQPDVTASDWERLMAQVVAYARS